MRKVALESEEKVIRLSSYDTTDHSYYSISNPGNAYGNTASSYCQVELTRGSRAETYFYFKFDTSSIPQDAEIDSIDCVARVFISNTTATNVASKGAKVCSGTTEKTDTISITRTVANRTFTMGTWTREELNDVRIKFYATRGTANVNTSIYFRIYVGTLTVNYTVYETYYDVTCSSNSPSISFSGDGEHSSGDNVTVTITGDLTDAVVTDNGVDVTSSLSGSGTTHTYTISGIAADHAIVVTFPSTGQEIFVKQNGSWVAVDTVYVKQNGVWKRVESLYIKDNGRWKNDVNVISPLPDGYTEVQYIQNSGTAYIQTSISGDGSSWEITAECSSASQNEILVCRASSAGNWYGISYNSGNSIWASTTVSINTQAHIVANFISKAVNGEVNGESFTRTGTSTSTNAFQIFGYNGTYSFIGKVIGDVICKQSNNKVFHGVPCISPDNEVGLYDLVSGTFLGSSNTSTFTAGPPV